MTKKKKKAKKVKRRTRCLTIIQINKKVRGRATVKSAVRKVKDLEKKLKSARKEKTRRYKAEQKKLIAKNR